MATPNDDKINMVLWFKDDVGVPIYRWVKWNFLTFFAAWVFITFYLFPIQFRRSWKINVRSDRVVGRYRIRNSCQIYYTVWASIFRDRCKLISPLGWHFSSSSVAALFLVSAFMHTPAKVEEKHYADLSFLIFFSSSLFTRSFYAPATKN